MLYVVAEENQDRDAHDQHKPSAGCADTLRILDRRRGRKAVKGGCLGGIGKAPRDQPVTLAGKLVDQADRLDLNHIGHRDAEGSDDQAEITQPIQISLREERNKTKKKRRLYTTWILDITWLKIMNTARILNATSLADSNKMETAQP